MIRMVIADDHAIVRGDLQSKSWPPLGCAGGGKSRAPMSAGPRSRRECGCAAARYQPPGLAVWSCSGAARRCPLPVLILSMHNEARSLQRALKAGAKAMSPRQQAQRTALTGVRKVAKAAVH